MATLKITDVYKQMGKQQVLQGLSFEAAQGEIVGIAGENGAGKSTLIKILASVLRADRGQFALNGVTDPTQHAWKKQVAWVPQDIALDDNLSVKDNLKFWAALSKESWSNLQTYLAAAYEDPLIRDFLGKQVKDLSGGMKRRANLVSSIFVPAQLLLLDEPFAGADEESQHLMSERIRQLAAEGALILLTSHDHDLMLHLSDRILYLKDGTFH